MNKFQIVIIFLVVTLMFSCKNDSDLGYNILPDNDKVKLYTNDTSTIIVSTLKMDTISSSRVNKFLLGDYNDPKFGNTKASFAMQFTIATYPENNGFSDSLIADYVDVELEYDLGTNSEYAERQFYGTLGQELKLKVYELTKYLNSDSTYYSDIDPNTLHNNELLGEKNFYPYVEHDSIFKIRLSVELANKLLHAENEVYSAGENFRNFFNGIYITAETTGSTGSIVKFHLNSKSKLNLYYHYPSTPDDKKVYTLTGNSQYCGRMNLFSHDYSSTTFSGNINNIASSYAEQDTVAYMQAMQGLRLQVNLPFVKELKKLGRISIYRAELVVNTAPENITEEESFAAIPKLIITGRSQTSEYYLLPEYLNGTQYIDESYTEDKQYRFDIAGYINDILEGTIENDGLYLFSSIGSQTYERSIVTTGRNSNPMRLIITYAKLD